MSGPARSYGTLDTSRHTEPSHRPRRRRGTCSPGSCLLATCGLSILILILAPCLVLWYLKEFLPFPGAVAQPDLRNETFAVGIDLTAGYGTAAISYRNGTTLDVARVDGDDHYNEVMGKLSLQSSSHPTPPYYNQEKRFHDYARQLRRRWRKWRGLPASEDVAALARVLANLKPSINGVLGPTNSVKYALVTVPYLPAIYNEDLVDACKHVGIQFITAGPPAGDAAQWPPYEVYTAYGGTGFGLCRDFLNHPPTWSCGAKEMGCSEDTAMNNVFVVLFTPQALTAHVSPLCSARGMYAAGGIANFSLGLDALDSGRYGSEEGYWQEVRRGIRNGMAGYRWRGENLRRVISHGVSATHEIFQGVLRDEVLKAQTNKENEVRFNVQDPVFAGARGAAEVGKRCMLLGLQCVPDLTPRMQGW